jgi:hypothetical protein
MLRKTFLLPGLLSLALIGCLLAGCGYEKPTRTERDPGERPILRVLSLYSAYRTAHGNKQPQTIDQLKAWVKGLPKEKREALGVEDPDRVFISPRDNQPFQLNPVVAGAMGGQQSIVIYEKNGVNGVRMTASTQGTVSEYPDDIFRQRVPSAKR